MTKISTLGLMRLVLFAALLVGGTGFASAAGDGKTKTTRVQVISGVSASNTARPAGRLHAGPTPRVRVYAAAPKLSGGPTSTTPSTAAADSACDCRLASARPKAPAPQIINIQRKNGVLVVNQSRHRPTN